MSTYIAYPTEEGSPLLVESTEEDSDELVRVSREGVEVVPATKKFTEAFTSVRSSFKALIDELDSLHVEEAEIKFGLKAVGEAGNIAIGKVGGEVNYEITLHWKKPQERKQTEAAK
jgi:hypothetical protein